MLRVNFVFRSGSWRLALLVAVVGLAPLSAVPADEAVRTTTSLAFVPDDAAFYYASLRNREQWDAVAQSRALAKLRDLPFVLHGIAMAQAQWANPVDPQMQSFKEFVTAPENVPLVELLADLVSNEMFVYGDASFNDLLAMVNDMQRRQQEVLEELGATLPNVKSEVDKRVFEAFIPRAEKLKMPDLVFGFRVTDVARAKGQLARLEQLALLLGQVQPLLQGRVKKETIGGSDYLTISLDGQMIPWNEFKNVDFGDAALMQQQFVDKFKSKTLVVAIGIHKDYVILSVGDTTAHLASLGTGKLLVDRPELAPVLKGPPRRLVSISYDSKELNAQQIAANDRWDGIVQTLPNALPQLPASDALKQELLREVTALSKLRRERRPTPTAETSFGHLTPRGYERFSYQWAGAKQAGPNGPLTVLAYVGTQPILFSGSHFALTAQDLDFVFRLIERTTYYVDQLYVPNMPPDEQAKYLAGRQLLDPTFTKLAATTRTTLLPALQGGQFALVIDAVTQHKQWHAAMPESSQPLPLPAPAFVFQVKDTAPLTKAGSEYLAAIQELGAKLGDEAANAASTVQSREFPTGTVYYFAAPKDAGLAPFVAPNAGLSKTVAVLSLLPQQSRRLLEPTTPPSDGPLAMAGRQATAASQFNFPVLVDVLAQWSRYAFDELGAGGESAAQVKPQLDAILAVLKCWKGTTSTTYLDGDTLVTHSESRYEDLRE